jgi:hypothetical protein
MRTYAAVLLSVLSLSLFAAHAVVGLHDSQMTQNLEDTDRDHSGGHYDWG